MTWKLVNGNTLEMYPIEDIWEYHGTFYFSSFKLAISKNEHKLNLCTLFHLSAVLSSPVRDYGQSGNNNEFIGKIL